jgi:DNA-binding transcriptional LysR family regulator
MPIDTRISLAKLEVFSAVVRHGGVGRAARHLYVSQPVVSAHIKSLQEKVGVPLFRKEGRGLELTEAGARVLAWAEDLLERSRELGEELDALAGGLAGSVTLGTTLTLGDYLLAEPLVEFAQRFPAVRVSMVQSNSDVVLAGLLEAQSDFAVVTWTSGLSSPMLTHAPVGRFDLVVVASPEARLPSSVALQRLEELPFVCPPSGSGVREAQDTLLASHAVVRRNVVLEAGSAESIKAAVRAGIGACLQSEMSVHDDVEAGRLRRIRLKGVELWQEVYLVHRTNKTFTPAQHALRAHLEAGLAQSIGE